MAKTRHPDCATDDLARVFALIWSFAPFHAIRIAIGAGILTRLISSGGLTSQQITESYQWQLQPTEALLSLLASPHVGFIRKSGHKWIATTFAKKWFSPHGSSSVAHFVERASALDHAYRSLERSLRTGRPHPALSRQTRNAFGGDSNSTKIFHKALDNLSRPVFEAVLGTAKLEEPQTVLDVGGGSGLFCRLLGKRWPTTSFTLFELPGVAQVVEVGRLKDRMTVVAGDWRRPTIRSTFDLVILAHVLHEEPLQRAQNLLKWACGRVAPHGQMLIVGFSPSGSLGDSFISNTLALNVRLEIGGDNPSLDWVAKCAREAGVLESAVGNLVGGQTYWLGRKRHAGS